MKHNVNILNCQDELFTMLKGLVNVNEDDKWSKAIRLAFKKNYKNRYLRENAYKTVKKYTWDKRCKKIINFFEKKM